MYNSTIKTIDVTKLGITKKCHTCKKVRKITQIEPEHQITSMAGNVYSNPAHHLCKSCGDEYLTLMSELEALNAAYNEIDDISEPVLFEDSDLSQELFYTGPEPPLFCVM